MGTMQEPHEVGKWVTDGKHTYPYNSYLDEMVKTGTLTFCEKPVPVVAAAKVVRPMRLPIMLTLEEREALAEKLGVSVGDVGNMSPQELAEAEAELASKETLASGFPS